jgi:hypothetical protein
MRGQNKFYEKVSFWLQTSVFGRLPPPHPQILRLNYVESRLFRVQVPVLKILISLSSTNHVILSVIFVSFVFTTTECLVRNWRSTASDSGVYAHKFLISESLYLSPVAYLKICPCYFFTFCTCKNWSKKIFCNSNSAVWRAVEYLTHQLSTRSPTLDSTV